MMNRPGFVDLETYLSLPRDRNVWLINPLIPVAGSALIYASPKSGKAINVNEIVPTPFGWKTILDIHPGNYVFGSNGKPVEVIAESAIMLCRPCFKVSFDDGNEIVVDANHEWEVLIPSQNKGTRPRRVFPTSYLAGHVTCRDGCYERTNYGIRLTEPLEYQKVATGLPLSPYLLGTWLGDGSTSRAQLTSADPDIIERWRTAGWNMIWSCRYAYNITHPSGKNGSLLHILRSLNVYGNKHIPDDYLYGSVDDRKELLSGLLDTDGSREGNVAIFHNTNRLLVTQVYELAVGLGCKVNINNRIAKLKGKIIGPSYDVRIRAPFNPFWLPRKRHGYTANTECYRSIKKIEPVPSVPVKCLVVNSPDHLFLVGRNCIPTHNSAIAIQLAQAISGGSRDWMGFPVGKLGRVLYLQLDTPRSTWALRFEDLKRHGVTFNKDLVYLADRETLVRYPLDILQPMHAKYLYELIQPLQPVAVIVDTLRKIHTGDENSSTIMSNVLANLVGAAHPAALILISHDRKPNPDIDKDIMTDHRGSSSIVAEMDAILRMTKNRLYYAGRSIEEGSIKIIKQDLDRALWWEVAPEEKNQALIDVLADPTLLTLRAKARALAPLIHKSEEAAMSQLRRAKVSMDGVLPQLVRVGDEEPRGPSTVPTQAASE